ncbi:hypothetical protein KKE78_01720 [Patescibacteria group bacterium]|nr:hypothetical protein [Patescibacteria group bacterium]
MQPENLKTKSEETAEKIAQEFRVNLPGENLPLPVRLTAFFTLIGGLSIIGSLFADIVNTGEKTAHVYLIRLIVGLFSLGISYGLIEKKRWAIWLYGFIAVVGLFINPLVALFPAVVVIYLIFKKDLFSPSIFDYVLFWAVVRVKRLIHKQPADY